MTCGFQDMHTDRQTDKLITIIHTTNKLQVNPNETPHIIYTVYTRVSLYNSRQSVQSAGMRMRMKIRKQIVCVSFTD